MDKQLNQGTMKTQLKGSQNSMFREIMIEESNAQRVNAPICADVHGQFFDLMKYFKVGGDCPDNTIYSLATQLIEDLTPFESELCRHYKIVK
ncbi:unnamed protein product [Paramecium octaurelia]|uniref:Protein-serine/threonine phosphatase n=1 Tax=Paramecium octaurelia TaxID=43137 RepID=A0A8S1W9W8_PAROT|nr:unnamed protein product [Paramecium octaurelia]